MKELGISALIGVSVVLLVWGLRGYLLRRFAIDSAWIARSATPLQPTAD